MLDLETIVENSVSKAGLISGVYFLLKDKELVYIGSSSNIHKRLAEHSTEKDYDSYYILPTPINKRYGIETEYIKLFNPPLNVTNSPKEEELTMDYIPKQITLTRKCGFDETTARLLGEVARYYGDDPRELAAYLLGQGVAEKARIMEEQLLEQAQWIDQAQTTEAEAAQ